MHDFSVGFQLPPSEDVVAIVAIVELDLTT